MDKVLSSVLFAVNTDRLLQQIENTGVGCHVGSRFVGSLTLADDITLMAPCNSKSVISIPIRVCDNYAADIIACSMGIKVSCYSLVVDPLL